MTTIASPRPSLTLSSRRTSTSTDTIVRSETSSKHAGATGQRKNRAALRVFYGLKDASTNDSVDSGGTLAVDESAPENEIDKPDFDAERYVHDLLKNESYEGLLRILAGLLKDMRGLDGEKKALVYDNYSKLIGATETIRKMRGNMEPLKPTFTTLTPAVSHIVNTAKEMSSSTGSGGPMDAEQERRLTHQHLVRHVLDTPLRLKSLLDQGQEDAAFQEWGRIEPVLAQWQDVPGSSDVREECEKIMEAGRNTT